MWGGECFYGRVIIQKRRKKKSKKIQQCLVRVEIFKIKKQRVIQVIGKRRNRKQETRFVDLTRLHFDHSPRV